MVAPINRPCLPFELGQRRLSSAVERLIYSWLDLYDLHSLFWTSHDANAAMIDFMSKARVLEIPTVRNTAHDSAPLCVAPSAEIAFWLLP